MTQGTSVGNREAPSGKGRAAPALAPAPTQSPPRPSLWSKGRVRTWLGVLFALLCLGLSLHGIDLAEVGAILRQTNRAWLGLALALAVVAAVVRGLRWRVLLYCGAGPVGRADGDQGTAQLARPLSTWRLTSIWLVGASLNLALPIPRSGDVARAYLAGEAGQISKAQVLGTVAAEKLLDIVMLAVCFLLLLSLMALPEELATRQTSVVGVAAVLILVVALVLWQRERLMALAHWLLTRLPGVWGLRALGILARGMAGLEALSSPQAVLWLAFWSVLTWLLSTAINNAVFVAMGLPSSWAASLFVLVVVQAGIVLPSTPGKVGVFQILSRWSLVALGFSAADGLAYGVLLYLAAPVAYMVLGALALLWESRRAAGRPNATNLHIELDDDKSRALASSTATAPAAGVPSDKATWRKP